MRFKSIFFSLILCAAAAAQQNPPSAPTVRTSRLGFPVFGLNAVPVSGATLQLIGQPGQATWFIWGVANYQEGSVVSLLGTVTNAANTLSSSNYIAIYPFYPAAAGVTVDILATSTGLQPSGSCGCAVSTGNTGGVINFQSNSLSSYNITPLNPSSFQLWLTNEVVGSASTHLLLRDNSGNLISDLSTAGAGTGCVISPTNANAVVFLNGSSTCASSANLGYTDSIATLTIGSTSTGGNAVLLAPGSLETVLSPVLNYSLDATIGFPTGTLAIGASTFPLVLGATGQIDACDVGTISRTSNVVTLVAGNNFCDYAANVWINVTGVTDSSFNGHFLLTSVSCCTTGAETLTYSQTHANGSSSSGHVALYVNPYIWFGASGPLNAQGFGSFFYASSTTDAGSNPTGMRFFVGASPGSGSLFGGGPIDFFAGDSNSSLGSSPGGDINLYAGTAHVASANNRGGNINLRPGLGAGSGVNGGVTLNGQPNTFSSGSGAPSGNCTTGSLYTNSAATNSSTALYVCGPANTWTAK
jgi:hypothetical protein